MQHSGTVGSPVQARALAAMQLAVKKKRIEIDLRLFTRQQRPRAETAEALGDSFANVSALGLQAGWIDHI